MNDKKDIVDRLRSIVDTDALAMDKYGQTILEASFEIEHLRIRIIKAEAALKPTVYHDYDLYYKD